MRVELTGRNAMTTGVAVLTFASFLGVVAARSGDRSEMGLLLPVFVALATFFCMTLWPTVRLFHIDDGRLFAGRRVLGEVTALEIVATAPPPSGQSSVRSPHFLAVHYRADETVRVAFVGWCDPRPFEAARKALGQRGEAVIGLARVPPRTTRGTAGYRTGHDVQLRDVASPFEAAWLLRLGSAAALVAATPPACAVVIERADLAGAVAWGVAAAILIAAAMQLRRVFFARVFLVAR